MHNQMRSLGRAAFYVAVFAAAATIGHAAEIKVDPANGVTETSIKLGWMGDETGGGASVELPDLRGLQAYAEYVNANGGIAGKKLEVIDLDDKFTPEGGTINFRRLLNDDRVLAIANMGGSHISTPLAPAVAAAKIPVLFPVQTIDAQLNVPGFFNLTSHFADQADVMVADAARAVGGADKLKMFVARLSVPSGQEFDEYIKLSLAAQGGTYAGESTMAVSQSDFTPTVIEIRQAMDQGANYVAVHGSLRTALGLLAAIAKAGVEVPVIGIQAHASPELFKQADAGVSSRFTTVQAILPPNESLPEGKVILDFVAGKPMYEEYIKEPYFSQGWLTGKFLKEAVERAVAENDGTVTRETLQAALKAKFDTGGLSCELDFTQSEQHYTPCATTITWDGESLIAKDGFDAFAPIFRRKYGL